jgi:type III restriction enzyme
VRYQRTPVLGIRRHQSALDTWVKGVNAKGGFGTWRWDVAFEPVQTLDTLQTHHERA